MLIRFVVDFNHERYEYWLMDQGMSINTPNDFDDDVELMDRFINDEALADTFHAYMRGEWERVCT